MKERITRTTQPVIKDTPLTGISKIRKTKTHNLGTNNVY